MDRYRDILYLVGGGPDASPGISRATALALAHDARLTLARVVADAHGGPDFGSGRTPERPGALEWDDLERLVARAGERGVDAAVRVLVGDPTEVVIREIFRSGHDLLIKDAEEPAGLGARLVGGVDRHLLRESPVPVWLLAPARPKRSRGVLAAVDAGRRSSEGLDERILRAAASLAAREGMDLAVVHAWSFPGESHLRSPSSSLDEARVREILDQAKGEREERLRRLVDRAAPGTVVRLVLEKGHPARVLEEVAARLRPDVLVLGARGRAGVRGWLLGNTAESLLGRVPCGLLAVKPAGFVSPVELDGSGADQGEGGPRPARRRGDAA